MVVHRKEAEMKVKLAGSGGHFWVDFSGAGLKVQGGLNGNTCVPSVRLAPSVSAHLMLTVWSISPCRVPSCSLAFDFHRSSEVTHQCGVFVYIWN